MAREQMIDEAVRRVASRCKYLPPMTWIRCLAMTLMRERTPRGGGVEELWCDDIRAEFGRIAEQVNAA